MAARIFLAGLLIFLFIGSAEADTTFVSGEVSGNWSSDHGPYVIQSDIHVPAGQSLSIGAGVKVYFDGLYRIEVDSLANFSAIGAEADSVVFTTDTLAHPLRWCGILIHGATDTVRLSYCVIENMRRDSLRLDNPWGGEDTIAFQSTLRIKHGPGLNLSHSSIRNNYASGFGMVNSTADRTTITRCIFSRNFSGADGGAALLYRNSEVENCIFEENSCWGRGGALYVGYGSRESSISSCIFRYNRASSFGGAVTHDSGLLRISNCVFFADSLSDPDWNGQGAALNSSDWEHDSTLILIADHCCFVANYATQFGTTVYLQNGSITNCSVVGAKTPYGGAAVRSSTSSPHDTVRICNTVVAFSNYGGGIHAEGGSRRTLVRHNLIFGNAGPTGVNVDTLIGRIDRTNSNGDSCDAYGNLFLDPMFVDTAAGDYHLLAGSPCIDAGDPNSPRDPDSTVADIGAYYYAQLGAKDRPPILYPSSFMFSAFPNPFNPTTTLSFDLPNSGRVSLCVYDMSGRLVETLADGLYASGTHQIIFDAANLSSGIYFARLKSANLVRTEKLVLLK
jgi:hypothetical protein